MFIARIWKYTQFLYRDLVFCNLAKLTYWYSSFFVDSWGFHVVCNMFQKETKTHSPFLRMASVSL